MLSYNIIRHKLNTKTILTSLLAVLSVLVLASFAVADVAFIQTSMSVNASHNSDVTVSFSLNNTGNVNYTALNWTTSTTSVGSWVTLPTTDTLYVGETKLYSAVLRIPQSTAPGIKSANIHVTSTPTTNTDLPITITVAEAPQSLVLSGLSTLPGTLYLNNTGNMPVTNINFLTSGDINVTLSSSSITSGLIASLAAGASTPITVTPIANFSSLGLGVHSVSIIANSTVQSNTLTYSTENYFCNNGVRVNESKIFITDIQDKSHSSAWKWTPLDDLEISVNIENNLGHTEDTEDDETDFVVELGIYDTVTKDFIELGVDEEDTLTIDGISLKDGKDETVTFEAEVPVSLQNSDGRYVVYVKAYVEDEEDNYCNSYTAKTVPSSDDRRELRVERDKHNVIFKEISIPEIVTAGETVTITATAYNIGTNDEDKVRAGLVNTKLGLNLDATTGSFELDKDDSQDVEWTFTVPTTTEDGTYVLSLFTMSNYDSDKDVYDTTSDRQEITLKVVGGKPVSVTPAASLSASLESSEVKAGSDVIIKVTLKNLNANATSFTLGIKDFESWASLNSISDRLITLNAGESKDVNISLKVNTDAPAGEYTFKIESIAGSRVDSKTVAVNVESSSFWASVAEGSTLAWVIGIACVVLLVLIIVLWIVLTRRN